MTTRPLLGPLLLGMLVACETTPPLAAPIGPAGGTISQAGVILSIPPGALTAPEPITITVSDAAPGGFRVDGHVYHFGPEGLEFALPVAVTFPGGNAGESVYWTLPGSTTSYAALATTLQNGTAVAHPTHFSSGFVGSYEVGDAAQVDSGSCITEATGCCNPGDITAQHPCSQFYVDHSSCDHSGGGDMPYCIASTGSLAGSPTTGWCCCHAGSTGCFGADASLPQPDAAPPDARPDHTVNDGSSPDAMATLDARPDHSTLDGGAPHDAPTAREARADGRADDGGHDAGGEGGREAGVDAGCFTEVMGCCNPGDITAQHPCSDYYVDYFSCDQPGGGDMPYCIASTGVLAGSPSTGWCCCHPGSTACFTLDGG